MTRPNVEVWLEEIKGSAEATRIGMCLIHNGVVRGTTRDGKPVSGMELTYDGDRLQEVIDEARSKPGVIAVKAWVNEGRLNVGDDIMYVLVAADIREHAFGALQELVQRIKTEVVRENEIFESN
ncbi:MAG: molybdenum cofactor biosynthesis protein MoaE [Thermoleophilia bacterium]|nr:molybdenum cofactor biosynthesis protein MoaE [Thermoleophilia bacterium]